MTNPPENAQFSIVFEHRDRLVEDVEVLEENEFAAIEELRRLSEQMSQTPVLFLTRS